MATLVVDTLTIAAYFFILFNDALNTYLRLYDFSYIVGLNGYTGCRDLNHSSMFFLFLLVLWPLQMFLP